MKLSTISAILFAAAAEATFAEIEALLAEAVPAFEWDSRFTNWVAPGPDDARGPCPGLNTLANHGFLPHSGKNISVSDLVLAGAQGLHVGPDFMSIVGAIGILSSKNPASLTFNLDDISRHNFPIEHDVSISRQDHYFGNWYDFNQEVWSETLTHFNGLDRTNTFAVSAARAARVENCVKNNPECTYGPQAFVVGTGESGLYVQTMSSGGINSAPMDYVRCLFEDNKLPFEQGWRPSLIPITLPSLGEYIVELFAVSPASITEGVTVVVGTYQNVLIDIVGGVEVLGTLTGGISNYLNITKI